MTDLELKIRRYELRNRKKFNQAEIARELKVGRSAVNHVVKRRFRIKRIEDYLNYVLTNNN